MGFFSELKRRNVFRVGTLYVVGAWVILQVADLLFEILELPEAALKLVFGLLVLGAPIALFLAWAYELTPTGLKPDPGPDFPAAKRTPSVHLLDRAIIGLLVIAVAYFAIDKFVLHDRQPTPVVSETSEFDRSVAALPFVNHGGDPDSLAFASGIHDDLLTQLAKISDLHVISNTSVREYAGTAKNVRQIGEELSVKHILEGGVQKAGNRIRINVQLIDATNDRHLWAETFDRDLTTENIFAIQSEIAREISKTLRISLSPAASEALDKFPTDNLEAYEDYVAGLLILDDLIPMLDPPGFERGIELLKSAVAKDPQFALAWVRIASAMQFVERMMMQGLDVGIDSHTALARAQEIDPELPQIHLVLASYAASDGRNEEALSQLALAERGLPGNAEIYLFRYGVLYRMGQHDEAFANIERAQSLDPKNLAVVQNYGMELARMRRYDEARAFLQSAIEISDSKWDVERQYAELDFFQYGDSQSSVDIWTHPDAPRDALFYDFFLASLYWETGDMDAAVEHVKKATSGFVGPFSFKTAEEMKAWIFHDAGLETESRAAAEIAQQKALEGRNERPGDPLPILALARLRALDGDNAGSVALANESAQTAKSHYPSANKQRMLDYKIDYSQALCLANELDSVEDLWREILSEESAHTLASLLHTWPPCRRLIFDTEHYRRLEEEFGHLSEGASKTITHRLNDSRDSSALRSGHA